MILYFCSFLCSRDNPEVVLVSKAVIGDHSPPPVMLTQPTSTEGKTLLWNINIDSFLDKTFNTWMQFLLTREYFCCHQPHPQVVIVHLVYSSSQ